MAASLHSLSLEHIDLILFTSDSGMFTRRLKFSHRLSFILFSTVERLYKVKLRSGKRKRGGDKHIIFTNPYWLHLQATNTNLPGIDIYQTCKVSLFCGNSTHQLVWIEQTHSQPSMLSPPPSCAVLLQHFARRLLVQF